MSAGPTQERPNWFEDLCPECRVLDLFNKDSEIRQTRSAFLEHKGENCFETNIKLVAKRRLNLDDTCPLCQLFYNARTGNDDTDESVYCILGASFLYGSFSIDRYAAQQHITQQCLKDKDEFCFLVVPHQLFRHDAGEMPMQNIQDILTAYDVQHADPVQILMLVEDKQYEWQQLNFEHLSLAQHDRDSEFYLPRVVRQAEIDYNLIKSWLSFCKEDHDACQLKAHLRPDRRSPAGLPRPIKLIDCQTREMVETTELPRFATLSYVWGQQSPGNQLQSMHAGDFLGSDLPAVVRDAIEVAMKIDMQYIWIDKYCIDQTDDFDRISQISMMDKIYALSSVTIVAAAGSDAEYGLPGVGTRHRTRGTQYLRHDGFTVISLAARPETLIRSSTWATRGWTLQEATLSRRRLVFTDEQVYFECNHDYETEALRRAHSFSDRTHAPFNYLETKDVVRPGYFGQLSGSGTAHARYLSTKDELSRVGSYLSEFMDRKLSYASDRVNAFRGIFRFYKLNDINGVPFPSSGAGAIHGLVRNLTWQHINPWMCDRFPTHPSFSWAGWTGVPQLDLTAAGLRSQGLVRENFVKFLNIDLEYFDETTADLDRIQLEGFTTKIRIKTTNQRARLDKSADFILNRLARESSKMETLQIAGKSSDGGNESRIFDCLLVEESERSVRGLVIARRGGFVERIGILVLFTDFYRAKDRLPGTECVKETLELR